MRPSNHGKPGEVLNLIMHDGGTADTVWGMNSDCPTTSTVDPDMDDLHFAGQDILLMSFWLELGLF